MSENLKSRITRHISMSGPLPLAEFMHWSLADKNQGYYNSHTTIGATGDFITAPEVSQMFGELLGVWAISTWKAFGEPPKFNLIELGPGRGTLMKDLLRAGQTSPDFTNAVHVTLIETSERMRLLQQENLRDHPNVQWLEDFEAVPDHPTIFIANEFLDVLPVRQYVKHQGKWLENSIGFDHDGNLSWVLGAGVLDTESLPKDHIDEPDGAVFEVSTAREAYVNRVADKLSKTSGAALFIDYGHIYSGFGDTFQAVKAHGFVDPLKQPGSADLTSHVDFEALSRAVSSSNLFTHQAMTQGEFLQALGLLERAGSLGRNKSGPEQAAIKAQAERLALPDQMGDLFKVFCFSSCKDLLPFTINA